MCKLDPNHKHALRILAEKAATFFPKDIYVENVFYYVLPSQARDCNLVTILFDCLTTSPKLFGKPYDPERRRGLLNYVWKRALPHLSHFTDDVLVDFSVRYTPNHGTYQADKYANENPRQIVPNTETDPNSFLGKCARRWDVPLLQSGPYFVSPDPSTPACLEAIVSAMPVYSILEIGAGTGIAARVADNSGASCTLIDNDTVVCNYLREQGRNVIEADVREYEFDTHHTVTMLGTAYEIQPQLLGERGADIARHTDVLVIQSGSPGFYQWEHDWLMGQSAPTSWPWFEYKQTIGHYFPHVFTGQIGYLSVVVGMHELNGLYPALRNRGMHDIVQPTKIFI